jgi:hypothetical protein
VTATITATITTTITTTIAVSTKLPITTGARRATTKSQKHEQPTTTTQTKNHKQK